MSLIIVALLLYLPFEEVSSVGVEVSGRSWSIDTDFSDLGAPSDALILVLISSLSSCSFLSCMSSLACRQKV